MEDRGCTPSLLRSEGRGGDPGDGVREAQRDADFGLERCLGRGSQQECSAENEHRAAGQGEDVFTRRRGDAEWFRRSDIDLDREALLDRAHSFIERVQAFRYVHALGKHRKEYRACVPAHI
jgi:hypothetical protein